MAKIINNILCGILAFVLIFAWVHYCTKNVTLSAVLAAVCAVSIAAMLFLRKQKPTKKQLTERKKKAADRLADHLAFCENNAELFAKLLENNGYEVAPLNFDSATAKKQNKFYVAIDFSDKPTAETIRQIVLAAKRNGCGEAYLFCRQCDNVCEKLLRMHVECKIFDARNTYDLLERAGLLPQIPEHKKVKQRIIPQYAFNRRRFGWYMWSSVFLVAASLISFTPLYTLIWATVLAAVAFYCLFNRRFNVKPTESEL